MTDEEQKSYVAARSRSDAFCNAYIRESPRPDCDPPMRFRVTLPSGCVSYHTTQIEAYRALMKAIGR